FTATDYPLHGRISQIPARLVGYGERWDGDDCTLWAEGEVAQTAVFGENLVLRRRIEAALGGAAITVSDRVENRGFRPTPHMLLYHYNFGYPLLDAGALLLVPSRAFVHTVHQDLHAQGVGYRIQGPPKADFSEQVYEHDVVAAADGMASAALINPALGAGGFGIRLEWDRTALPCLIQWQCLQSGLYVLGIEPSTNHVLGRKFAEHRDELAQLEHGETRDYRTRLSVRDGAEAVDAARRDVEALHPPPADFAPPTGEFPRLGGRS
ncbi:MAG: aldose 1-epimerase family protein, partial [Geminicoccaceae bacterium]